MIKSIEKSLIPVKILTAILTFFTISNTGFGQQVLDIDSKITAMRESSDEAIKVQADKLAALAFDLNPSLYYQNGKLLPTEEISPIRVNTDVASISLMKGHNSLYKNVEIICIKLQKPEDLQLELNLSDLSGFTSLKYIYFMCTFNLCNAQPACERGKIADIIKDGTVNGLSIVYNVTISE